jgi:hypothetical protein
MAGPQVDQVVPGIRNVDRFVVNSVDLVRNSHY